MSDEETGKYTTENTPDLLTVLRTIANELAELRDCSERTYSAMFERGELAEQLSELTVCLRTDDPIEITTREGQPVAVTTESKDWLSVQGE